MPAMTLDLDRLVALHKQYDDDAGSLDALEPEEVDELIMAIPLLVARLREVEADNGHWRNIVKDTCDDMECSPSCNSYFHGPECPVTNPKAAWGNLRARLQAAEGLAEMADSVLKAYNFPGLRAALATFRAGSAK